MDQLKGYSEQHHRKNVKQENGRILIERTDQWEKIFRANETEGGVESSNIAEMFLICDACSQEMSITERVELKGFIFHRGCARDYIEELLDRSAGKPGSVDPDTELHARMLLKQLRREGRRRLLVLIKNFIHRRGIHGKR